MSKLFRSCTALLMALCLILGVCGTGIAASAAEAPEFPITEQSLVDWAKDVLDRALEINLRDEDSTAQMGTLVNDVIAETEAKIAEVEQYIDDLETYMNDTLAEANQQLADAKAQVADAEQKVADAKAELADAKAKLADAKAKVAEKEEELKNAPIADKADLEAELANAKAELADAEQKIVDAEQKIADAEKQIADAKEQIAEAEELRDTKVAEAEAAIADARHYIAIAKKALNEVKPYVDVVFDEAQPTLDKLIELYDAMKKLVNEGCSAAGRDVQTAAYELLVVTYKTVEKVTGKSSEKLEKAVADAKEKLNDMFIEATQTTLDCIDLTKIVALGDKNAYGVAADKFADRVSEFLGKQPEEYVNMTVANQTAVALRADLEKYAEELSDATLITLSFNTNAFTKYAMDQAAKFAMGKKVSCDWATYVGEDAAAYVEEMKTELFAKLEAKGYTNIPEIIVVVECYAYAYAQHVLSYYPLVRDIQAINPDAQIVMVGMHNNLEGVVAEIAGVEVPLGDFMRYLSDISNIYSLSYAMLSDNKLYVDAYGVEVVEDEESFLKNAPSDAGYAEIADRIWNALNIQDHKWVLDDVTDEGEWHVCEVCGAKRFETYPPVGPDESGDMIGVVVALLAVSGLGITVLKRRED